MSSRRAPRTAKKLIRTSPPVHCSEEACPDVALVGNCRLITGRTSTVGLETVVPAASVTYTVIVIVDRSEVEWRPTE